MAYCLLNTIQIPDSPGRVVRRARDSAGELIGKTNPNPLLDTSEYEVQFEDGAVERYHANIIAEHIYSRVDSEGNTQRFTITKQGRCAVLKRTFVNSVSAVGYKTGDPAPLQAPPR